MKLGKKASDYLSGKKSAVGGDAIEAFSNAMDKGTNAIADKGNQRMLGSSARALVNDAKKMLKSPEAEAASPKAEHWFQRMERASRPKLKIKGTPVKKKQ